MSTPTLGISTWSVRRLLGPMYPGLDPAADRRPDARFGGGSLTLLDLPEAMRERGYTDLDLCHFHLPRTDGDYLDALRGRLDAAGVRPLTLLVDEGDISATDAGARERDLSHIRAWIVVAARLGARYVRVASGEGTDGPEDAAIRRSADSLAGLARYAAQATAVRVLTENWRPLALPPGNLLAILDAAGDAVGLCADFGNCAGAGKYDALRAILPRATTVHAKAEFDAVGRMDDGDFRRCLALAREAGCAGTYVLIFSGPGDEWAGLAQIAATVRDRHESTSQEDVARGKQAVGRA